MGRFFAGRRSDRDVRRAARRGRSSPASSRRTRATCPTSTGWPTTSRRARRASSPATARNSPTSTPRTASGCRSRRSRCRCATRSSRPKTSISTSITASTSAASCARRSPTGGTSSSRARRRSRSSSRAGCSSRSSLAGAQGAGSAAGDRDRALLHEGRDPRALPQHHLLRFGRLRHPSRSAHVFRHRRLASDDRSGRDAGRLAGGAVRLLAVRQPATRARAAASRPRPHGGERLHLARARRSGAREAAWG